ncbi:TPA: TolC family protein, partial [Neisseria bacilliformis]
ACRSTDVNLSGSVSVPQTFEQNQNAHGSDNLAQWWQNWHDPVLNALIERGLRENRDILAARSRLTEAAEQARLARADLGPTLGASALASVGKSHIDNPLDADRRNALARLPQAAALADDTLGGRSKTAAVGFTASWEPDIFGQKRSDADAARYAALGRQEQLYGTQLLVAGDIADHYFQARAAEGRLKTAGRSISALQNMLRYVQGRFTAGHATAYDLEQARAALAAMQAKHSTIAAERAAHVRSIAVLTG